MQHHLRSAVRLFICLLLVAMTLLITGQPLRAQNGADMAVSLTGARHVRIGTNITYTISATNIGNETAMDVQLAGGNPDWFDFVSIDCRSVPESDLLTVCEYGALAPGKSVSMTITLKAVAGNKAERHMYEGGGVTALNDVNPENDYVEIPVIMTGPCPGCPNK